jgi:hypothetical protein
LPSITERGIPRLVDFDASVSDVVKSLFSILSEATTKQAPNPLRSVRWQPQPVRFGSADGAHDLAHAFAVEGCAAREHFEEHASERPHVRGSIDLFPADLFR